MDLMTKIADWWNRGRSQCVVCRREIPEDDGYCSEECWESTHL